MIYLLVVIVIADKLGIDKIFKYNYPCRSDRSKLFRLDEHRDPPGAENAELVCSPSTFVSDSHSRRFSGCVLRSECHS